MPLVFVHGVNMRKGETEDAKVDARDRLFRTIGLAGLVQPPATLHIENPYWGGHGATFSHNLAALPHPGTETFGPAADDAMTQVLTETLPPSAAAATASTPGGKAAVLLTLARQDPKTTLPLAVDAVVAAAANRPVAGDVAKANEALARFAAAATAYLGSNPDTKWLFVMRPTTGEPLLQDDKQFLEALVRHVTDSTGPATGPETFGPNAVLERLKGAAAALGQAAEKTARAVVAVAKGVVGAATGAVAGTIAGAAVGGVPGAVVRLLRPEATQRAGIFVGDVFTYLNERGDKSAPGEIVKVVHNALRNALAKKTMADSKLIVVGHSMGGNIVYDVLTHFDSSVPVDLLVTVGSQVALFKEMRLYMEDRGTTAVAGATKAKKPAAVGTWLNVFDPLDVLGFAASGVFEGVKDYAFSTQANPLDAHSMYFYRPTFHERLRARMAEVSLGGAL